MKIAISSVGKDLDSLLDQRFGRAKYFIIYDTVDKNFIVQNNEINFTQASGAGVQSAQNVVDLGAQVLISGNCGPKAFRVLSAANIKIYKAPNLKVNEAIELFNENKLEVLNEASVDGHW